MTERNSVTESKLKSVASQQLSVTAIDRGGKIAYSNIRNHLKVDTSRKSIVGSNDNSSSTQTAGDMIASLASSPYMFLHKVGCTRPYFHVSPSGKYFAVVWDNLHYELYQFSDGITKSSTTQISSESTFTKLETGLCVNFAWSGTHDTFILTSPGYSVPDEVSSGPSTLARSATARNSIFGKKQEIVQQQRLFHPTKLVVKRIDANNNDKINSLNIASVNIDEASSLDISSIKTCFSGLLIACNYSKNSNINTSSTQSKSSLESSTKLSGSISMSSNQTMHNSSSSNSLFLAISPLASLSNANTLASQDVSIMSIGPVMQSVEAVAWNYSTGHCAVVIGDTVTILRLSLQQKSSQSKGPSSKDKASQASNSGSFLCFDTITSYSHNVIPLSIVTSMSWQPLSDSMLIISTNLYTTALFCPKTVGQIDSYKHPDESSNALMSVFNISRRSVDAITLASSSCVSEPGQAHSVTNYSTFFRLLPATPKTRISLVVYLAERLVASMYFFMSHIGNPINWHYAIWMAPL